MGESQRFSFLLEKGEKKNWGANSLGQNWEKRKGWGGGETPLSPRVSAPFLLSRGGGGSSEDQSLRREERRGGRSVTAAVRVPSFYRRGVIQGKTTKPRGLRKKEEGGRERGLFSLKNSSSGGEKAGGGGKRHRPKKKRPLRVDLSCVNNHFNTSGGKGGVSKKLIKHICIYQWGGKKWFCGHVPETENGGGRVGTWFPALSGEGLTKRKSSSKGKGSSAHSQGLREIYSQEFGSSFSEKKEKKDGPLRDGGGRRDKKKESRSGVAEGKSQRAIQQTLCF